MTVDLMDANASLGFVASQLNTILPGVYATRYPEIRYQSLGISINTSANEWTKGIIQYTSDEAGRARWIADRTTEIPVVGVSQGQAPLAPIFMAGIGYDYGLEEVNQARILGQNLTNTKALAARRAYERFVDKIVFEGDTVKGFSGLFNNPNVAVTSAPNGSWATAAEDDILADINALISGVFVATNEIAMANTLLLPSTSVQLLGSKRLGDTTETIMDFLRRSNVFTSETGQALTIRGMRGLDTAGAGGTPRAIAFRNDSDVMEMHIPMPHRFLPVERKGLLFQVPGIFRLGGLEIRLPGEVRYQDGI